MSEPSYINRTWHICAGMLSDISDAIQLRDREAVRRAIDEISPPEEAVFNAVRFAERFVADGDWLGAESAIDSVRFERSASDVLKSYRYQMGAR